MKKGANRNKTLHSWGRPQQSVAVSNVQEEAWCGIRLEKSSACWYLGSFLCGEWHRDRGSRRALCLEVCFELCLASRKEDAWLSPRNRKRFLDVGKPCGKTRSALLRGKGRCLWASFTRGSASPSTDHRGWAALTRALLSSGAPPCFTWRWSHKSSQSGHQSCHSHTVGQV